MRSSSRGRLPRRSRRCDALDSAHRAGIIHRDLKPGNVMLTADGGVKLMDFGVALQVTEPGRRHPSESVDRLTREGRGVGTIRYMSPEQLRGTPIDARSDLFALGIVLWELFTGLHPFLHATNYATAAAIVDDPPKSGPYTWPPDAAPWQPIVLKLLQKDPARRYPDAGSLIADLDKGVSGRPWGLVRIATAVALIGLASWLVIEGP
jgi:serine/threonine protein kinase